MPRASTPVFLFLLPCLVVQMLGCTLAIEPSHYGDGTNEPPPVLLLGGERASSSPRSTAETFTAKVGASGQPLGWVPQLALPRAGDWMSHASKTDIVAFSLSPDSNLEAFSAWDGTALRPWVVKVGPALPDLPGGTLVLTDAAMFVLGNASSPDGKMDRIAVSLRKGDSFGDFAIAPQTLATGRFRPVVIQCQGHLLAVGGEGNHLGDPVPVEHFDFAKLSPERNSVGAFQKGPAMAFEGRPHRVSGAAVVCTQGFVFVIGGLASTVNETTDIVISASFSEDGKTGPWKSQGRLPAPSRDAVAFAAGNRLVLAGGRSAANSPPSTKVLSSVIATDGTLGPWVAEPRAALPDGLLRAAVVRLGVSDDEQ